MIKNPIQIQCVVCGRKIWTLSPNRKYCSEECYKKVKLERDKKRQEEVRSYRRKRKTTKTNAQRKIDSVDYCRNYAENQKQETLRLLREGKL